MCVFVFAVLVFGLAVFVMLLLVVFGFCVVVHDVHGITEGGSVFRAFVRGVGFEFSAIRGTVLFDFLSLLFGEFGFGGSLIFGVAMVGAWLVCQCPMAALRKANSVRAEAGASRLDT